MTRISPTPSLSALTNQNYSLDCRVYTPENPESNFYNVRSTLDIYVLSHFFGWIFKALLLRNTWMSWIMSIQFEIYELSLRHWLPNFYECWWDSLLLDLFGCNAMGILIGAYIINRFNIPRFHWFFEPNEQSEKRPYYQRFFYSLVEVREHVEEQRWHVFASAKNLLTIIWFLILNSIADLNNFLVKKMVGIPSSHFLLITRFIVLCLFGVVMSRDFYDYTRMPDGHKKINFNMYMFHFILLAEVAIFVRNFQL